MKDMTQGKPLKLIIGFAIPMLIGNIFQQVYNVADMISTPTVLIPSSQTRTLLNAISLRPM